MSERRESTGTDERPLGLVVDDYQDGRDIASRILESIGLRTLEAANGHDALECALRHHPDVLVLDLALPGVDGWTVTRRLKEDPATTDIMILGFTAHAERGLLDRAREAGCDAVLTKPCPPSELARSVRELLDRRLASERRPDLG